MTRTSVLRYLQPKIHFAGRWSPRKHRSSWISPETFLWPVSFLSELADPAKGEIPCVITGSAFPLADPRVVLSMLGYC